MLITMTSAPIDFDVRLGDMEYNQEIGDFMQSLVY